MTHNKIKKYSVSLDILELFTIHTILSVSILYISNSLLISNEHYYYKFSEQLPTERITELIYASQKWQWIVYVSMPLITLFKCFLVTLCVLTGAIICKYHITFKSVFKIVLLAEYVFLLPHILKLVWFSNIDTSYNLNDLQFFSPLSLITFFNQADLEPLLIYPLSLLNFFEAAYILIISFLLKLTAQSSFTQSFKLTAFSYGTGLSTWIIFITFLTVTLMP